MAHGSRATLAILLIICANGFIPVVDAMAKVLTQRGYPVAGVVWSRYVFHLLPLLLIMPVIGWRRMIRTERPGLQVGRALLLMVGTLLFIWAIGLVPLAEAYAVSFASPLILTALAAWLLREPVSAAQWTAVGVGFLGVLIVLRPTSEAFQLAMLLPLGMAATWALFQLATRSLSYTDDAWASLFYTGLVGTIALFPASYPMLDMDMTAGDMMLLVGVGIVGLIGHILLIQALYIERASVLAPFNYFQIIFGTLFSIFLFNDSIGWNFYVGGSLIVGTGLYCMLRR